MVISVVMYPCTAAAYLQATMFTMIIMQFILRVDDIPNTIYHICYACQFSIIGVNKIAADSSPIDL